MNSLLKFTIICFFVLPFTFVNAQIPTSIDGVTINTDPINPTPGKNVTVSLESYNTDLNSASIIWLVDGKTSKKGTGVASITVPAPNLGKSSIVTAVIMTIEGKEIKKSVTLKSGDVDIIWESAGYVPPLYKGKTLFAYENDLKITAIPHIAGSNGKELDPKTLVYKWTENNKVIQNQSGYGKQTINLKEDLPRPIAISVDVSTRDGGERAVSTLTIEPGNPSLNFYEEDSLYGIYYNKALTDKVRLVNQEIRIIAVPYLFSTYKNNSPIQYTWSINGLEQPDLSTNQSIVLRTKDESEGSSLVSLEVRNTFDILQGAKNALTVFYGKKVAEENNTFK